MNPSTIEMLQAGNGDGFIIKCHIGENQGVIVVDGGVPCNKTQIELLRLGKIDLMVLTHFDDDHIGGIKQYIEYHAKWDKILPVKKLWLNNCRKMEVNDSPECSLKSAMYLADLLENKSKEWSVEDWKNEICEGQTYNLGFATIEIISPTKEYAGNMQVWKDDVPITLFSDRHSSNSMDIPLKQLANTKTTPPDLKKYSDLANACSVAFILRCDDFSILMLGDSFPDNVEKYLRGKGYSESNPLVVDYLKVSHHGSKNNTSSSLLSIIATHKYIISTNSKRYYHPDREAIARIVCAPNRDDNPIDIYINYPAGSFVSEQSRFINEGEEGKYNFKVHYNTNILP